MTRVLTAQEANELIAELLTKGGKPIIQDGEDYMKFIARLGRWWELKERHGVEVESRFCCGSVLDAFGLGEWIKEHGEFEQIHVFNGFISAQELADWIFMPATALAEFLCKAFIYAMTGEVVQIQKDGE